MAINIELGVFEKNGIATVAPSVWFVRDLLNFLEQLEVVDAAYADEKDGKIEIIFEKDLKVIP